MREALSGVLCRCTGYLKPVQDVLNAARTLRGESDRLPSFQRVVARPPPAEGHPAPYDQVSLDNKVRHVGDRVAVVAAETPEIAQQALKLIEVDYEVLPAVFDPDEAMRPGAPVIHDEPDAIGIKDASRNIHGAPQAEFALECLMNEAAALFSLEPIEFRRPNWVRDGL